MFIEIHKISYKYYCKDKELTISHNEYGCSWQNIGLVYYLDFVKQNEIGEINNDY